MIHIYISTKDLIKKKCQEHNFINPSDFMKFICLSSFCKIKFHEIKFGYSYYGKPLVKKPQNKYISVSHSDNLILCAISENNIGIDIEKMDFSNMIINKRIFHPREYNYINNNSDIYIKLKNFYEIWTLKESYLKFLGVGIYMNLNSFSVLNNSNFKSTNTILFNDYSFSLTTNSKINYIKYIFLDDKKIDFIITRGGV
ncbi:4'-phosphopantetheinyl transferase family protein [Staphylococcus epidermidis]|uniref:4'-phosphopantetheinyl transferase family protein n=1 Tax=Staphylococcus epidermidis TaxID=1282 RepID=UPI001E4F62EC|nr:4'-phosphopantetheinyl transferase superfamily protein [Staphylococcus epidermidis]MCD8925289.1 4'-phosphopantetheinyl transferase superfamily protein [Staphylococcus epidermidis]